jgi:hypothetical protein
LDSCVVFAEILRDNTDVMEKFKLDMQRRGISCYISTSVEVECTRKLDFTEKFFENVFRTFAVGHFNACRQQWGQNPTAPISNSDYRILADIFSELKKSLSPILQPPLRELEKKMILEIEDLLRKKIQMKFSTFLDGFISKVLVLSAYFRIQRVKFIVQEQGFFKKKKIGIDPTISAKLCQQVPNSKYFPFHEDDAHHISSAWSYMNANRERTVFATFDFRTILSHTEEIYDLIGLYCADPLYAVHFL